MITHKGTRTISADGTLDQLDIDRGGNGTVDQRQVSRRSADGSTNFTRTEYSATGANLRLPRSTILANGNLVGGATNDVIRSAATDDKLFGYDGADTLHGEAGSDFIYGGAGNDQLNGGDGDDYLEGGAGADGHAGGAGFDTASYRPATRMGVDATCRPWGPTLVTPLVIHTRESNSSSARCLPMN